MAPVSDGGQSIPCTQRRNIEHSHNGPGARLTWDDGIVAGDIGMAGGETLFLPVTYLALGKLERTFADSSCE